jgi:hypothetical protein
MKKFFHIFVCAAVALGAVACQNDVNDAVTPEQEGEGVSIRVTIADQTRVALGDFEEGKGYKFIFEEGDVLMVTKGSGSTENYYFTYTKAIGEDTYEFTCTADGVSSLVGSYLYFYYQGGRKDVTDTFGNKDDQTIKGALVKGEGVIGDEPITMNVAPLLKVKSAYPVTITASDWVFNGYNSITTKATDEWVYISTHTARTVTITATIKGQPAVVKSSGKVTGEMSLTMEYNKIYNLGELDVMPEEPEEPVEGDTGVEITIDGTFADWANVTKIAATLPADATKNVICKTLKAYADAENIYGYMEVAVENSVKFIMTLDLDNDPSTGSHNWMLPNVNGEVLISSCILCEAGAPYSAPFRWGGYSVGSHEMVNSSAATTIADGLVAVEFAIARESINSLITGPNVGIGVATYGTSGQPSGMMPHDGNALVFPVPAAE